jgi:negative regulator of flagellin synthesis FlgM
MKIGQQPDLPAAVGPAGGSKLPKAPVSAAESAAKDAAAAPAAGVPVSVSTAARALDSSSRTTSDFDAGRVKAVKAAIEQGTFKVDAEAIADKLLANAQEIFSRYRG